MNQKEFMAVKVCVSSSWLTWAWVPMDLTGFPVQVNIASYSGSGLHLTQLTEIVVECDSATDSIDKYLQLLIVFSSLICYLFSAFSLNVHTMQCSGQWN